MSTPSNAAKLWVAQQGLCFHCDQPMLTKRATMQARKGGGDCWSLEHLVPRSKGGRRGMNIVLAHFKCNTTRGNTDPTEEMVRKARNLWHKAAQVTAEEIKHYLGMGVMASQATELRPAKRHKVKIPPDLPRTVEEAKRRWLLRQPWVHVYHPSETDPKFVPPLDKGEVDPNQ